MRFRPTPPRWTAPARSLRGYRSSTLSVSAASSSVAMTGCKDKARSSLTLAKKPSLREGRDAEAARCVRQTHTGGLRFRHRSHARRCRADDCAGAGVSRSRASVFLTQPAHQIIKPEPFRRTRWPNDTGGIEVLCGIGTFKGRDFGVHHRHTILRKTVAGAPWRIDQRETFADDFRFRVEADASHGEICRGAIKQLSHPPDCATTV